MGNKRIYFKLIDNNECETKLSRGNKFGKNTPEENYFKLVTSREHRS